MMERPTKKILTARSLGEDTIEVIAFGEKAQEWAWREARHFNVGDLIAFGYTDHIKLQIDLGAGFDKHEVIDYFNAYKENSVGEEE
jgi:hypothetical protein